MSLDAQIIAGIFNEPGASTLLWEQGRRCGCYSKDSKQPRQNCEQCAGWGVLYGPLEFPTADQPAFSPQDGGNVVGLLFPSNGDGLTLYGSVNVKGLFRSQSRFFSPRAEGELHHGEAQLTLPTSVKPGYVDRRVRDRFSVLNAAGDVVEGRVFYPAADPVPFLFGDEQLGWRVQVQSLEQAQRLQPQP